MKLTRTKKMTDNHKNKSLKTQFITKAGETDEPISYPEIGRLGARRDSGDWKKCKIFAWLLHNGLHCFTTEVLR